MGSHNRCWKYLLAPIFLVVIAIVLITVFLTISELGHEFDRPYLLSLFRNIRQQFDRWSVDESERGEE